MKKVLITGFEPFGGDAINPALEAVRRLEETSLDGGIIVTCQVPVTRFESIRAVIDAIEAHQPDCVITVGQAAGRAAITPERVAINVDDFRIPDNGGNQPIDEPIIEQGPDAYFSSLPIKRIAQTLHESGIPCQVSNSAGTFVCNHLFYGVQHYLRDKSIRHGFVHIPLLPEQATDGNHPSMSLDMIVAGLKLVAQVVIDHESDVVVSGGQIC
ncbi:pyroglutamyl-peptidase I [Vibrio parahaemolyticus]|uniref:pyroglutamyl-peptidase I n=1 Tax=Vibrio parahaemolyticus TaxID=670 RepID=UPI0004A0301B|nr:pyroglutamyl-peptidase I [Vibrio parahaemolyticus]KCV74990.1 pyrrolidone-carboxylate peptidase [Vibrio parahaemolyticus VP49]EHD6027307.1 pyroglutamyl-peptidase I [Vibrio parahaemolyticus]EJR0954114.1 pyroglutamyl-peptidase I [Vibrio parahaemolyticus]EKY4206063.1 pyroglutamyl-peptidase I [Vibrio parahaemolyticus]EMA9661301.1 pyroglutamyl-peptidase I [Vibrio parahaemolyticus]